jgi:hypothetical protein
MQAYCQRIVSHSTLFLSSLIHLKCCWWNRPSSFVVC